MVGELHGLDYYIWTWCVASVAVLLSSYWFKGKLDDNGTKNWRKAEVIQLLQCQGLC